MCSQHNTSVVSQAAHHAHVEAWDQDDEIHGHVTERMGVALFFCLMSIVAVVGLYLCFWAKVERGNRQDTNSHNIKVT